MHEYSVTQEIIQLIGTESRKAGITKPRKAVLHLGRLSGFQAEPIRTYFDLLKVEDPLLAETILEIEEVAGVYRCAGCGREHIVDDLWMLSCPTCPGSRTEIITGKDLLLKSITGDTGDGG